MFVVLRVVVRCWVLGVRWNFRISNLFLVTSYWLMVSGPFDPREKSIFSETDFSIRFAPVEMTIRFLVIPNECEESFHSSRGYQ